MIAPVDRFLRTISNSVRVAVQRRKTVHALFALTLVAAAFALPRLRLELDVYDLGDASFPATIEFQRMKRAFDDAESVQLLVRPVGVVEGPTLCSWLGHFRKLSNEMEAVVSIRSAFDIRLPRFNARERWYEDYLPDPCAPSFSTELYATKIRQTPWRHWLSDRAGRELTFNVRLRTEPGQPLDVRHVGEIYAQTKAAVGDQAEVFLVGASSFGWHLREAMKKDAWLNFVLFALFLIFFRLTLGTWVSGLLYVGSVTATCLLLFGTMALLNIPVDALTNSLVLMTAIAGVADFLFVGFDLLGRAHDGELRGSRDQTESFARVAQPGFFTSWTTFLGFISLTVSDLAIIRRFGLAAAAGTMLEWMMTFWVMPNFLPGLIVNPRRVVGYAWLAKVAEFRPPRALTLLALLPMLVAVFVSPRLNYDDDPTRNFPVSHLDHRSYDDLQRERGWRASLYLLFKAGVPAEEISRRLLKVGTHPLVAATEDPRSVVDFFTRDLRPSHQDLIVREQTTYGALGLYHAANGETRAPLYLKESDLKALRGLQNWTRTDVCADQACALAGQSAVYMEYSEKVSRTLAESFALSLGLVLVTLMILARANHFAVMVSVTWGPLLIVFGLWLLQVPLNLVTGMFMAVIIGMAGDNSVQYLFGRDPDDHGKSLRDRVREKAAASVALTMLLCTGSLVFMFQTLKPMKILGALFASGFALTLIGDLWILKGLLDFSARRNPGDQTPGPRRSS